MSILVLQIQTLRILVNESYRVASSLTSLNTYVAEFAIEKGNFVINKDPHIISKTILSLCQIGTKNDVS